MRGRDQVGHGGQSSTLEKPRAFLVTLEPVLFGVPPPIDRAEPNAESCRSTPMNKEDRDLFAREMAGVQPIRASNRLLLKAKPERSPGQAHRREAAQRSSIPGENFLTTGFVELVHPQAELSFMRPGIQHGVFRKLRQGAYPIDAILDLHQMTLEEARREVYAFIYQCMKHDVRSALISHGKGGRHPGRPAALLKSYLANWLPQFPEVMAFHSAQGFHGGTGAMYVLLRKSEKRKQRTRRRLGLAHGKPEL